jgi:uncharacterized protein
MKSSKKTANAKAPGARHPLVWGFVFGIVFGFLLHKGGVTKYDVILGQLLLEDFTVIKVMLSAVVIGMIGIYAMKHWGWVTLDPKAGSWGANVVGGLIFGVGFALLGYCPGTIVGAIGNGYFDALVGGVPGILIGAGLFAHVYPRLRRGILQKGDYGDVTLPQLLKMREWVVVPVVSVLLVLILIWIETLWPM